MTEEELIEGCKKGDNSARHNLYQIYAGGLMAICIRYISDREQAQDILHDGFLKIFHSFHQFTYRGEGSLKAWLSRIIANQALEYLRQCKHTEQEIPLEDIPAELTPTESDEDLNKIPQEVLMRFICELPKGYRTVLNMFVFEEKSHREIAKVLGISEHTSSSQLFRAKTLLAQKVTNYLKREDRK